jgi:tRNA G37 N-methylase Trm5
LAIAAAKLGVKTIDAFDFDPVCVEKCAENAALNRLEKGRIRFYFGDVLQSGWLKRPADVVCANILTHNLIQAAPGLCRATRKRSSDRHPRIEAIPSPTSSWRKAPREVLRTATANGANREERLEVPTLLAGRIAFCGP